MADDAPDPMPLVRIPTVIHKDDAAKARAAFDAMNADEQTRFWKMVDGGTDKFHALNLIRSQRAQDAARGTDISGSGQNAAGQASAANSLLVQAGQAATGGGIPTIAAALGHGEGDTFAERKKSNVADAAEMTAQNPIAASVGEGLGLALPAVGGAGRLLTGGAAAAGGELGLMQLAKEGAKAGAALGAPLGALQTDTGSVGSIVGNAALGAGTGAATGALGSLIPGAAIKLAPSLGEAVTSPAQAVQLMKLVPSEALMGTEDALVAGSSAAQNALANVMPAVGKWGGAVLGHSMVPVVGGVLGSEVGARAGANAAQSLRNAAMEPYLGASMPVPSTGAEVGADVMMGGPSVTSPSSPSPPPPTQNSPVPEITRVVDQPQPAPTSSPPPQVDFDVSGHPEGMGPADFPLVPTPEAAADAFARQAAGQAPRGGSISADDIRAGLRLGEPNPNPRVGPNPTGITPESQGGAPVGNLDKSVAARPIALARAVQQEASTSAMDPAQLAQLQYSMRLGQIAETPTTPMDLMRLRALQSLPEAQPPADPSQFPGQGIRLAPWAEPGTPEHAATFMMQPDAQALPGVGKMPARFPTTPSGDPSTWTPSQQAQAARVAELDAQLVALPPDQRAQAVQALAQAHGSAPWQAGRLGANDPWAPFKMPLTATPDAPYRSENAPSRPASEFGAHTPKQELAGVTGFGALPAPSGPPLVPSNPVEDAMAPAVKAAAEAQMRQNLAAAGRPVEEDLPSFVNKSAKEMGISGGDLKSRTWKAREEGENIAPTFKRQAAEQEARADALPRDRDKLLQQILDANGIGDHDSAAADNAYRAWKTESARLRAARKDWIAGGRQGAPPPPPPPKPTHNLGGMLDSFDAVKDNPGKVSSLLEAWEKQTKGMKTYRDLKPALAALADALGVDDLRLPDEVIERHIAADARNAAE